MRLWSISVSDAISDLKARLVAQLDVYEFLDILGYDMQDLVDALHDVVVENRTILEDTLD
jgi:hypothetical protein